MDKTTISLKWINNESGQIEIELLDGNQPERLIYPFQKNAKESQDQYEYIRRAFFLRIRDELKKLYGERGMLSEYGILKDDSDLLKCLICWPIDHQKIPDGKVSVEKIPANLRIDIINKISQMASGWGLSNAAANISASGFAEYAVDNYRWLFDFEISTVSKSLLNINKDALELEWYVFNHDDRKVQQKFSELAYDKSGVGLYQAKRWQTIIDTYLQHWEI